MSTSDRLPSNVPLVAVRDARQSQRDAKATQFTGQSSARAYWSQNSVNRDWEGRLSRQTPQAPDFGDALLEVKFEAPVDWPMVDYVIEVYSSSNGTSWTRLHPDQSGSSPFYSYTVTETPAAASEPRAFYVYVWITALLNSWAGLKVLGMTNDELTVTVTRVG